jgi:manganese/zinc/iron transport system permease protein
MPYGFTDFFTDPILRAPTIGSMLMCASSSLIGVIVFIRKRSLVGEALSHAAYPGLVLMSAIFSFFTSSLTEGFFPFFLIGAFATAFIAFFFLKMMQERFRVKSDAALCFVLSSFFGVGLLVASHMQKANPLWYRQIQTFLYGQSATMTDVHILIYGAFFLAAVLFVFLFYRTIQLICFDKEFAHGVGVSSRLFENVFAILLVSAVVISMKSVGVILLSGMLIAPALGARQLSHKLFAIFPLAALIGALSGFAGNYFSVKFSQWGLGGKLIFPTGPMIILFSSSLALICLLFAPGRGHFVRFFKRRSRSKIRALENLLKVFKQQEKELKIKGVMDLLGKPFLSTFFLLKKAERKGTIEKSLSGYTLSLKGNEKASEIVHYHALWKEHLRSSRSKVHADVEEMKRVLHKGRA